MRLSSRMSKWLSTQLTRRYKTRAKPCFPGSLAHAFSPQPSLVRSFELGSAVSRFKLGDRALGYPATLRENESPKGAFQAYTVLAAHRASQIPSTLSYESGAVLPLGLSTAACGLFQKDYLALQYPSVLPNQTEKRLLVWGGSDGNTGLSP